MGPNLYFVKEATGADSAVVVFAVDIVASIDFNTGQLNWSSSVVGQSIHLDDRKQVGIAIHDIFKESPFN